MLSLKVKWIENKAFDEAELFNTDLVNSPVQYVSEKLNKCNEAHGKAFVVRSRRGAKGIAEIIRARQVNVELLEKH